MFGHLPRQIVNNRIIYIKPFGNEGDFPSSLEYIFTFRLTNTNPYLNAFYSKKAPNIIIKTTIPNSKAILGESYIPKDLGSQT